MFATINKALKGQLDMNRLFNLFRGIVEFVQDEVAYFKWQRSYYRRQNELNRAEIARFNDQK